MMGGSTGQPVTEQRGVGRSALNSLSGKGKQKAKNKDNDAGPQGWLCQILPSSEDMASGTESEKGATKENGQHPTAPTPDFSAKR